MAKFEALMENKMKMDTQTEQSKPQSSELSDQELAQASGGGFQGLDKSHEWKRDSQGRVTHWKTEKGPRYQILHYTCPRCGRILHRGTMGYLYCDPCDDWFMSGPDKMVIDEEG